MDAANTEHSAYDGANGGYGEGDAKSAPMPVFTSSTGEVMMGDAQATVMQKAESITPTDPQAERKLIYTARIALRSREYDACIAAIEQAVAEKQGYVETVYQYNNNAEREQPKQATYTIRVPQNAFDALIAQLKNTADVLEFSSNVQDASLQYADMQTRIESLQHSSSAFWI